MRKRQRSWVILLQLRAVLKQTLFSRLNSILLRNLWLVEPLISKLHLLWTKTKMWACEFTFFLVKQKGMNCISILCFMEITCQQVVFFHWTNQLKQIDVEILEMTTLLQSCCIVKLWWLHWCLQIRETLQIFPQ